MEPNSGLPNLQMTWMFTDVQTLDQVVLIG